MMYNQKQIIGVGIDKHIQIWDERSGRTNKLGHFSNLAKMNYLDLGLNNFTVNYSNMMKKNMSKYSNINKTKSQILK